MQQAALGTPPRPPRIAIPDSGGDSDSVEEWIEIEAPATIANVGAGYDVFGFAVDTPRDKIRCRIRRDLAPASVAITSCCGCSCPAAADEESGGGGAACASRMLKRCATCNLCCDHDHNTACTSAAYVLEKYSATFGLEIQLLKGMGVGEGLGSSGACAAAGAKAAQYFLEDERWRTSPGPRSNVPTALLLEAAIHAENVVNKGTPHGDNACPSFLGGFVVVPDVR